MSSRLTAQPVAVLEGVGVEGIVAVIGGIIAAVGVVAGPIGAIGAVGVMGAVAGVIVGAVALGRAVPVIGVRMLVGVEFAPFPTVLVRPPTVLGKLGTATATPTLPTDNRSSTTQTQPPTIVRYPLEVAIIPIEQVAATQLLPYNSPVFALL